MGRSMNTFFFAKIQVCLRKYFYISRQIINKKRKDINEPIK
jgi:hypothetical protein